MPEILASRPTPPLLLFAVKDDLDRLTNDGSCRDQLGYRAGDDTHSTSSWSQCSACSALRIFEACRTDIPDIGDSAATTFYEWWAKAHGRPGVAATPLPRALDRATADQRGPILLNRRACATAGSG